MRLLIMVLVLWGGGAMAGDYSFKNYSLIDGISHKTISCFTQDKKGFIWIGTTNGLNRFDGYTFKKFLKNRKDSLAIGNANIKDIVVDKNDFLWVSTEAGIYYFNPRFESFHKVKLFAGEETTKRLCTDDNGDVWALVRENYLVRLGLGSHEIVEVHNIDSLLGNKNINNYFRLKNFDGYLWVNGTNGAFRFDTRLKSIVRVFPKGTNLDFIQDFKRGKKNEILVVAGGAGVYSVNTTTLQYSFFAKDKLDNENFKMLYLSDAEYCKDGDLLMGGFPGLFSISEDGSIARFNHSSKITFDFDKIICNTLFRDNEGNVWVGTMDDGVFVLNNTKNPFTHYTLSIKKFVGLHAKNICVVGDKIYATNLYGAFCFDRKSMEQTILTNVPVFSIAHLSGDDFILFTNTSAYNLNMRNGHRRELFSVASLQNSFVDSKGVVWVTRWGGGMQGINYKQGKKYQIHVDTSDVNKNIIYTMTEDRDGSFWLGTFGSGLVHVENPCADKPTLTVYSKNESKNSISHNVILSLHDDQNGSLWIGTNGGGLNHFDKKTGLFTVYNAENGLKSDVVEVVNTDLDGNVWFGSSVLTKFDVHKKLFTHFDISDGVVSKYFTNVSSRGTDGILYFGDDCGVLAFDPRAVTKKSEAKTPVLTDVKVFGLPINPRERYGNDVPFPVSVGCTDEIVLPYHLSSFTIDFATIDPLNNRTIEYSYRMEGVENTWIRAGANSRHANYSALRPGTYTFSVRACTENELWSPARSITVTIVPPWWKTWWFKVLVSLVLTVLVSSIVFFRFRTIKHQRLLLEKKVQERTEELSLANHQLSHQNEQLTEHQIVIEMRNLDLNEALEAKDELITVVSHDFKNPLSGIIGVAGLLKGNTTVMKDEKVRKLVDTIFNSASSLVHQMASVLDWAQSLNKNLEANPIEINLETLLDDAISLVRENAVQKNISIAKQLEYETNVLVDPRMVSTVFRNLLSNAIKFTHPGGSVMVTIQEFDNGIDVVFIDTGVGMTQQQMDQVFEGSTMLHRSYGTANEKGTGVGLQVCKSFVEKNGGSIKVSSHEGQGSVFTVSLPKGQNKASMKTQVSIPVVNTNALLVENEERATILVIDDSLEIRETIFGLFDGNYTVVKAEDGNEGLYIAQNILPDIIISDINMPGKTGIEICKVLKNHDFTSHIPILLITSQSGVEVEESSYESGANDFIEKPFNPFVLKQKVQSLLDYRKQIREQIQKNFDDQKSEQLPPDYDSKVIKKVIEFIEKNISNADLDTENVAEQIGVSRSQLWRIFKNTTGKTLGDYIREIRMKKAAEMLRTGKYRIGEIAEEVGYSNSRNFAKNFHKEYGMTPSEYADTAKK